MPKMIGMMRLGRDADAGVAHRETKHAFACCLRVNGNPNLDLAPLGELDRIPDQIDDDLAQTSRVAKHP